MSRISKYLSLILACLFLAMAGTSNAADKASDQVNLKIGILPGKESPLVTDRANWAIIKRFMEIHPNIKLVGFEGLNLHAGSLEAGPMLAMAGGVAPDVLYLSFRMSDTYIQQSFLYPLDNYYKQWAKEEDLNEKIYPPAWQVIKRDGHIWAVPISTFVMTLMYRKDLFRKAGLDPDRPPQNWDELWEYGKKLTVPEDNQYGIGLISGPDAGYWWVDYLWSAGGEAVAQDKNGDWHAVFNDKAAVTALKFYQKLGRGAWTRNGKAYRGVAYRDPVSLGKLWELGKIGMQFGYMNNEMLNFMGINPNVVGFAPVPKGPTGMRGNELNCAMLGINNTIKDKRVRDAAWEYIKFQTSDEAAKIRVKVFAEAGYAKFLSPKYLRKYGYEQYLKETPPGWEQTLETALKFGRPEPYGRNCQMIFNEMSMPLESAMLKDDVNYQKLLDTAVSHANEKLMGYVPPDVKQFRRKVALVVVIFLGILFALVFRLVMKSFSTDVEQAKSLTDEMKKRKSARGMRKKVIFAGIIMAPAILSVALWAYYPLIRGSIMAFQDYKLIAHSRWVGLDNFAEVLFTPDFWASLWRSALFAALSLGLGFFSPIILALMLHEVPRGRILYRTLYYLPAVTTGLVIMFLWKFFYLPTPGGFLNKLLLSINDIFLVHINQALAFIHLPAKIPLIEVQTWLQDPKLAMLCVIIPMIWATVGPGCIIYLAALNSVPEDNYEAADLDGAGVLQKVWHITIPFLRPLIIINFVGAFIGAFRSFDYIFIMTGGGPVNATRVAGLEIWYNAFMYLKFGYAVSMAWLLGSLLVGFTLLQLRILSRLQFKQAGA